jgi:prepilin-type N-terminal cleavage/methylation domain-containing protein
MRPPGNKAFTLVELLVVIIVIGILATLVVPAVLTVLDKGKQTACNQNVKGILQGLKQYSAAGEEMPMVPVKNWNVEIGTNVLVNPFSEPGKQTPTPRDRNHSANMWLLVRGEHVSMSSFICPGTLDTASDHQDIKRSWDFGNCPKNKGCIPGRHLSYGMQSPYGYNSPLSVIVPLGVVLVADGSPYTDATGVISASRGVNWAGNDTDEEKRLRGNSRNHDSNGQNVGYKDGRAEWQEYANVGKNSDDIYSATNETDRDEEKSTSQYGRLSATIKNNPNDTWILP